MDRRGRKWEVLSSDAVVDGGEVAMEVMGVCVCGLVSIWIQSVKKQLTKSEGRINFLGVFTH